MQFKQFSNMELTWWIQPCCRLELYWYKRRDVYWQCCV